MMTLPPLSLDLHYRIIVDGEVTTHHEYNISVGNLHTALNEALDKAGANTLLFSEVIMNYEVF